MEKEFLHVRPDIVCMSRNGTEIGRFPMENPICLIGKSRDADIIISIPGVKNVHCQLELCQGEVLFTDYNGVERFLQCNDKYFVMDREFKIHFAAEPINEDGISRSDEHQLEETGIITDCKVKPKFKNHKKQLNLGDVDTGGSEAPVQQMEECGQLKQQGGQEQMMYQQVKQPISSNQVKKQQPNLYQQSGQLQKPHSVFTGPQTGQDFKTDTHGDDAISTHGDISEVIITHGVDKAITTHGNNDAISTRGNSYAFSACGNNDAFITRGNNDAFSECGNSDAISTRGNNDAFSACGNNDAFITRGNNDAFSACGNNDAFITHGNNDAISTRGNSDAFSACGNNDAFITHGNNDAFSACGNNDAFITRGNNDAISTHGNNNAISTQGDNDAFSTYGNNNAISTCGNKDDISTHGNNNAISTHGNNNAISTHGDNDAISTQGDNDAFSICGNNDAFSTCGNKDAISTCGNNNAISSHGNNDAFSTHGNNNAISTQGDNEAFSTQGDNDAFSTCGNNDSFSTRGKNDAFSTRWNNYAFSTHGNNNAISTHRDNDTISTHGNNNAISTHGNNNAISTRGNNNAISTRGNSDAISTHGNNDAFSTHGNNDAISTHGNNNAISTQGDNDAISTCGNNDAISTRGDNDAISTCGNNKVFSTCGDNEAFSTCGNKDVSTHVDNDAIGTHGDNEAVSTHENKDSVHTVSIHEDNDAIGTDEDGDSDMSADTLFDDSDADKNYYPDESEYESEDEKISDTGSAFCEPSESEPDDESGNSTVFPQLRPEKILTFQRSKKNSKGNIDNKKHCCLYCEKMYPNIARHLELMHANEVNVAKVLMLPKKSTERRRAWSKIVNQGDFNHNYSVYEQGYGTVIPKYRVSKEQEAGMHVPCMFCRGLYKKTDLWKHQKTCQEKDESSVRYGPVRSGKLLLPKRNASKELHENILVKMRDDATKRSVLSDDAIIQYGNSEYQAKCHIPHNRIYLSNRMRELGRLLLEAQKLDQNIKSVTDLMQNKKWDLLVRAVKQVANFDEQTGKFGIPSLAEKLGQHMKNCAEMLRFEALKTGEEEWVGIMDTFIQMYRSGWNKEVSSLARYTSKENKYNKPQLLPLVEDIVQLNRYLDECGEQVCEQIKSNPNSYVNIAKVLLAKIILFNRKRSGEAERMTLKQFHEAKSGEVRDPVIKKTLSKFEQRLCRSHLRVEIRGKKMRKVPVLLTEGMLKWLNILIEYRSVAGVTDEVYVFARPGNSENPYRGCDALRDLAESCKSCKHPENITSTKLRKQLATCAQLLNMRDFEQDLLATFQGHDIRVHREFYRLPESMLQIAKMSKVLHCINNGTIQKYKGCNFDDIEFEENETVEEESDDDEDADSNDDEDIPTEDAVPSSGKKGVKRKRECTTGATRQAWSDEEKKTLERVFAKFIKEEKVPGKLDIINVVRSEKVFGNYNWKRVKYAVYNIILGRRKKSRFM